MLCCNQDQTEENLVIHGVKVTSNVYNHDDGDGGKSEAPPLVLLHGYMNGSLYFYRNLLGLSDHSSGGTVYALDMLGWGLSSRPPFKTKTIEGHDEVHAAEQFFVESLEAWRQAHKIDKMNLGGHSMGGYLSVAYCEKYPQYVDNLILISPAGVPDDREIDVEGRLKSMPLSFKLMRGAATSLWNVGVNPASFLRRMPESRGRDMVKRYIEGRLPAITCPDERAHLGEYLYTNAALPGSGENCLNRILKPTAFGIKPLLHRIPSLKVKNVSFIYGQSDWMSPTSGIDALTKCKEMKEKGFETPDVQVYGVKNAGHLLMLENYEEFNSAVVLAAGSGHRLSAQAPMPYQVLDPGSSVFFGEPRWGKKKDSDGGSEKSAATTTA